MNVAFFLVYSYKQRELRKSLTTAGDSGSPENSILDTEIALQK